MKKSLKQFLGGFKFGFKNFSHSISLVVNLILLSVIYFIGVGLTLIVAKLFKKKFLDTLMEKKPKTYWSPLDLGKRPLKDYYRQF